MRIQFTCGVVGEGGGGGGRAWKTMTMNLKCETVLYCRVPQCKLGRRKEFLVFAMSQKLPITFRNNSRPGSFIGSCLHADCKNMFRQEFQL